MQSVYETIGLARVINANGRMSVLGVSTISDEVAKAMQEAGQSFVVIDDLMHKAGEIISTYTKSEASCVTVSASAAISMSIAALIAKSEKAKIERLPDSTGLKNEVIMQKGHVVNFGAPITSMIRIGGGLPIEVGMANEVLKEDVEQAINEQTVALFYVKSHHCVQKGMLSIEEMLEIARKYNLPLIVDAAAEENLTKYIAMGVDMVIYSGAKAIEGPTSGFVSGKKKYIENVQKQYAGIGRGMKIGKESIMGLLKALELYVHKDEAANIQRQKRIVAYLNEEINKIEGLLAKEVQDEAGREIYRSEICVDATIVKKSAQEIDALLKAGNPSIHCRKYKLKNGIIVLDPRSLNDGDEKFVVEKLKKICEVTVCR